MSRSCEYAGCADSESRDALCKPVLSFKVSFTLHFSAIARVDATLKCPSLQSLTERRTLSPRPLPLHHPAGTFVTGHLGMLNENCLHFKPPTSQNSRGPSRRYVASSSANPVHLDRTCDSCHNYSHCPCPVVMLAPGFHRRRRVSNSATPLRPRRPLRARDCHACIHLR